MATQFIGKAAFYYWTVWENEHGERTYSEPMTNGADALRLARVAVLDGKRNVHIEVRGGR